MHTVKSFHFYKQEINNMEDPLSVYKKQEQSSEKFSEKEFLKLTYIWDNFALVWLKFVNLQTLCIVLVSSSLSAL